MESALMMTGLTVGSFFLLPAVVDFVKSYTTPVVCLLAILAGLYLSAPYSPEAMTICQSINQGPQNLLHLLEDAASFLGSASLRYTEMFR